MESVLIKLHILDRIIKANNVFAMVGMSFEERMVFIETMSLLSDDLYHANFWYGFSCL